MISYPPRAQLSDTLLVNGQQSTRSIQALHRAGQEERDRPVTSTETQSSSSLIDSLLHSDKNTLHASSPWSIGSPLSGSTLCPTPQSSQFEYDGIGRDRKPYPGPRHAPSCSETTAPTSYTVETWHPIDDAGRIRKWKSHLYRLSPFTTLISMVAYFLYYTYRIHCTLDAQRVFNQVYIMAWIFISAEGCVAFPTIFHQFYQMLSIRPRHRPKLRLRGESVPTIDVLITCCGEDLDIALDTVRAACVTDYPRNLFRVVVLDDGNDSELRKAIGDIQSEYPHLHYHSRLKIKGVPHHYKAGNLSDGTHFVTKLDGGPGEYIAALDADMIPEPDWLRALLGHAVNDDRMALVCLPQMFYNVPDSDPLCQSLDAFIHVMEPTKDANGVAWCTGSGYVVRRKALEAIGGWPVGSLAEDVYTSSLLLGCGWRTAYCHEPLQWGTVPDTLIGHLKQRTRWTVGTFRTAIKLNFCLYGKLVRRMSVCARLSAAVFAFDVLFKIFLPIAILTIPVVLSSGGQLVAFTSYSQLRWKIRLCFISLILNRLNEWISFIPSGYRLAQRDTVAQMWMAPFHGVAIIRGFFLPSWLGGTRLGFLSSGSVKSTLNERDQKSRAPLFWRLKVVLWDYNLWMHLAYAIFLLVAVFRSTIHGIVINDNAHSRLMYLFTHAFWPPMLWLLTLTASLVPIRYAVWPPNMPDREELLLRDPKTWVARPREEWKKKRYSKFALWHEMELSVITVYVTVIFLGSLFYIGDTD